MVRKTVSVPLEIARPEFTLSRIAAPARLQEMEFYFPMSAVTPANLAQAFTEYCEHFEGAIPSTIDRLQFRPMSGFMKGFIDLIFQHQGRFYIVDWKSNWLGPGPESYSQKAMDEEMESKFYRLQLSIYSVALHRLPSARLPDYSYETHFGGVFYLFLRGIEPSRPDLGVWRTRLEADFVERLSGLFDYGA